MDITLKPQEAEEIFLLAVSNSSSILSSYGLELMCDNYDYAEAKERLRKSWSFDNTPVICWEDVLLEVLRGGKPVCLVNHKEGETNTRSIMLDDVHSKVGRVGVNVLINYYEEQDDAKDASQVIQTVFYDKIIFA